MNKQDTKKRTVLELEKNSRERRWIEHQNNATKSIIMAIDTMIELAGPDKDILEYAPKLIASKLTTGSISNNDLATHATSKPVLDVDDSDNTTSSKHVVTEDTKAKKKKRSNTSSTGKKKNARNTTDSVAKFEDAGLNITGNF